MTSGVCFPHFEDRLLCADGTPGTVGQKLLLTSAGEVATSCVLWVQNWNNRMFNKATIPVCHGGKQDHIEEWDQSWSSSSATVV